MKHDHMIGQKGAEMTQSSRTWRDDSPGEIKAITGGEVAMRARQRRAGLAQLRDQAAEAAVPLAAIDKVDRASHRFPDFDARALPEYELAQPFAIEVLGCDWAEEHMGDPWHRIRRFHFAMMRARDWAARSFARIPDDIRDAEVDKVMELSVDQWDLASVAHKIVRLRCLSLARSQDREPIWVPLDLFPASDNAGLADRPDPRGEDLYQTAEANCGRGFYIDEVLARAAVLRQQKDDQLIATAHKGAPRAYRVELAEVAQGVFASLIDGWWALEAFLGECSVEPLARVGSLARNAELERNRRTRNQQRQLVIWRAMLATHPERWVAYKHMVDRVPSRTEVVRAIDHQNIHRRRLPVVLAMVRESIAAAMSEEEDTVL